MTQIAEDIQAENVQQNQDQTVVLRSQEPLATHDQQQRDQTPPSSEDKQHQPKPGISNYSSQPQPKKRYKYCCRKCKHTEKGKRACVCVVPLTQRRHQLGDVGCQTCGCHGCSIQDYVARGQDPQYKPWKKVEEESGTSFQARNGCCKRCIKAFSRNNKSCLCQVPKNVRKQKLPAEGCKFCGCQGCNPQDVHTRSRSRSVRKDRERRKRKYSSQDEGTQLGFNNLQGSAVGVLIRQANIYGPLIGFGIPQRTKSYIFGRT